MGLILKMLVPVNIAVAIYNCLLYSKNWERGIFLYCVLSCVWPLTRIGNVSISYEILGFVFLLPAIAGRLISLREFMLKKQIVLYEIFFALFLISTVISSLRHNSGINFVLIFAYFRLNVLLLIFMQKGMATKWLKNFFDILVPINFIACLIQVYIPRSYIFFCSLYVKRTDVVSFIMRNNEQYDRLYGTFSICTQLAIFSLMATTLYIILYLFKDNGIKTLCYLMMSIITGIGAACKSYFLGGTLLIVYLIVGIFAIITINKLKKRQIHFLKRIDLNKALQILISVTMTAACIISFSHSVSIEYHFNASFKNFEKSMEIRFSGLSTAKNEYLREGNDPQSNGSGLRSIRQAVIAAKQFNASLGIQKQIACQLLAIARRGGLRQVMAATVQVRFAAKQGTTISMVSSLDLLERLIGVGATVPYGEFIGDSEIIMLYHHAGIIGLAIILFWLLGILMKSFKKIQVDSIIYIVFLILGSSSLSMISSLMGTMIIAYVITNINSDEWRNRLVVAHDGCRPEGSYGDYMRGRVKFRVRRRQEVADCEF